MTPALLREIAEALCGPRCKAEFARHVGVSERLVRYWLAGEKPVPERIRARLLADLEVHQERCRDLRRQIR